MRQFLGMKKGVIRISGETYINFVGGTLKPHVCKAYKGVLNGKEMF
jgi:hypothetical protein